MNRGLVCLVWCAAMGLIGCSPSGPAQPAAQAPASSQAAQPAEGAMLPAAAALPGISAVEAAKQPSVQVAATASPDQVVQVFLDALKQGDIATKAALLTQRAREETAREHFDINPQSAPNAVFEVKPAQYLPENPHGAHVISTWTETYPDDGELKYDVVWVLRKQPEGWRIAGMAIELVPGAEPACLNFEDAADMAKKYADAMAATQPPAAEVANRPDDLSPAPTRTIER